jgi:NAD(P)-dependent dehydrogenase (short-subunit alcohol dehydrogenase family)
MKNQWDSQHIPDQTGKVILITGATSGLGKEAASVLAGKHATIILAARDLAKARAVVQEIRQTTPDARLHVHALDLNSLQSVQHFAGEVLRTYPRLDVLINNAGIMACPFAKTEDGFEVQMGVNHLGHFALTGLLMPLLTTTPQSRIVATSSIAHQQGKINFEDFHWEKRPYNTMQAYSDSKIANLYFAYELTRRLKGSPKAPLVTAAHPGWTSTELQRHSRLARVLNPVFSQPLSMGVLPTLRAACEAQAQPGTYFGPSGFMEMRGYPVVVSSNALSHQETPARRLWELSETLTQVVYPVLS